MAAASAYQLSSGLVVFQLGILLFFLSSVASADDVSRASPSGDSAACGNDFRLVKVRRWVNGIEKGAIGGLTADFGSLLPAHAKDGHRYPAMFSEPLNGCLPSPVKTWRPDHMKCFPARPVRHISKSSSSLLVISISPKLNLISG